MKRFIRWITRWAWRSELDMIDGWNHLKSLHVEDGKMEVEIESNPALAQYVGTCFASMVASSPNYTEMVFDLHGKWKGKYEIMTVTVQKLNGKTPHQLRQEAELEVQRLKKELRLCEMKETTNG